MATDGRWNRSVARPRRAEGYRNGTLRRVKPMITTDGRAGLGDRYESPRRMPLKHDNIKRLNRFRDSAAERFFEGRPVPDYRLRSRAAPAHVFSEC